LLVPQQQHFDPFIPTVYVNIDYREWQRQLTGIDEILRTGLVEERFQRLARSRSASVVAAPITTGTRLKPTRCTLRWSSTAGSNGGPSMPIIRRVTGARIPKRPSATVSGNASWIGNAASPRL
jgi:hypothetical protein